MRVNGVLFENTEYLNNLNLWAKYLNTKGYENIDNLPYEILNNSSFKYSDELIHEFEKSVIIINNCYEFINIPIEKKKYQINTILILAEFLGKDDAIKIEDLFKDTNEIDKGWDKVLSLFTKIGLHHEIPPVFRENLDLLGQVEFNIIHHILSKKSMRKFKGISFSKTEAHFFKTCEESELFRFNAAPFYLIDYIQFCKFLKKEQPDKLFLQKFFFDSRLFYKLNIELSNTYWQAIYREIINWDFDNEHIELTEIIDYFDDVEADLTDAEYKMSTTHYIRYPSVLKNNTKASLLRHVRTVWMNRYHSLNLIDYKGCKWTGDDITDAIIEFDGLDYHFTQILTGELLFDEGKTNNHCVLSYLNQCIYGSSSIWKMSCIDGKSKSNLTIEIKKNRITQVAGLNNRGSTGNENLVINKWMDYYSKQAMIGIIKE